MNSLSKKRAILEYWTLVEFFSPYLLHTTLDTQGNYQRVFADEPCQLPWSEQEPLSEDDPASPFAKGYHLYLGLFSIEETADRARHVFCEKQSVWQTVDWKNCILAETLSCFARLTVTKFGTPLLGTLTLSTLPWAHGKLLNKCADSLTMEAYWKEAARLLTDLKELVSSTLLQTIVREPKESAAVLDYKSLSELVKLLFQWAGYAPKFYPITLIEPLFDNDSHPAYEPSINSERDIPILNSFYIQELERASKSLPSQENSPLDLYLSRENKERVYLEEDAGKSLFLQTLKPNYLPKGRWLNCPSKQQTLMQQFAINQALHSIEQGGCLSVNGPPGTGKTTLVREIIAGNIVKRAEALSKLTSSQEAFTGKQAIGFGDSDPVLVSSLNPSLLGYEMLVASSNNTSVQNLSHELPLRDQLEVPFDDASYLEPVAKKLFVSESKHAWGLISAALGNRENCKRLVDAIFFDKDTAEQGACIWDWAETYDGPTFVEAKKSFLSVSEKHSAKLQEIQTLAELHEEIEFGKLYPNKFKNWFLAKRKLSGFDDHKSPHITNIR